MHNCGSIPFFLLVLQAPDSSLGETNGPIITRSSRLESVTALGMGITTLFAWWVSGDELPGESILVTQALLTLSLSAKEIYGLLQDAR
jgi:hypothetical protein